MQKCCIYFVSLMENQLQGENKCKYMFTSLLVVFKLQLLKQSFIKCDIKI